MSKKMTNEYMELYIPELELVVVEKDNQSKTQQNIISNILMEYRILNDKCDAALNKIAQRKNRN